MSRFRQVLAGVAAAIAAGCADVSSPHPRSPTSGVTRMASRANLTAGRIAFIAEREDGIQIWLMDADGNNQVKITSGGHNQNPDWSPDGTRIAFRCHNPAPVEPDDICTMNPDGSGIVRYADSYKNFNPRWSPDGTKIAFGSDRSGSGGIYLLDVVTGTQSVFFDTPYNDSFGGWSPDGSRVVFYSNFGGNYDVWMMDLATHALTQVTTSTAEDFSPTFSPTGTRIAFASHRPADGGADLFEVDAETGEQNLIRLTDHAVNAARPKYSSDGAWLVYDANDAGSQYDVWKLRVANPSERYNLTQHSANDEQGVWEPVSALPPVDSLTALGASNLWIGLKNSDAVGLRIDLRVEVLVDDVVVGIGDATNLTTGSSGFNNAILRTTALTLGGSVAVPPGSTLSLRPSVRRTCFGGGHNSGTVRFWYDGQPIDAGPTRDAGSRFDATISGNQVTRFARTGSALNSAAGSSRTFADVAVNSSATCPARTFSAVGTWSVAVP